MSNIIDSIQLSGVTYTIQGSGGGKTIEAGRGISVTTGETADTVSFNLPISAGTGTNSIAEGYHATAGGNYSHAEGFYALVTGNYSHAEGNGTVAYNDSEHASGQHNVSSKASTTFGNSGNTLFSVGNGTAYNARHNAFEIRQNGDIYITSGGTDIKLQDHLGGSSITVDTALDSGSTNPVENRVIYNKIDEVEQVTAAGLNALNSAISGISGNNVVELTQAQYDALVTGGTVDPTAFYIITDVTPVDMSQYWTSAQTNSAITQATSGKVDTLTYNTYTAATDTALANKQTTLTAGTGIDITDNVISATGGGGKAVSGGTNISITTGETADTINCTLPIKQIVGYNSVIIGDSRNTVNGNGNVAVGNKNSITAKGSSYTPSNCFVGGNSNNVYNDNETAFGKYNNSVQNTLVGGESGTTLFSVGNGTANNARHNAFEIRQNGDIYLTLNGQDVKLQDQLGGGGGTVDQTIISGSTNAVAGGAVYSKIDEVEQVTAAGLNALNDAFGGLKLMKISQTDYNNLQVKDQNTLYIIVN